MLRRIANMPVFLYRCLREYYKRDYMETAASLTYYTLFSLAPLFLCVVALSSIFYSGEIVRSEIIFNVDHYVGFQSAVVVDNMMQSMANNQYSTFSALMGLAILIYAATSLFVEVQGALSKIFEVDMRGVDFVRGVIARRITAIIFLIALTLFLFLLVLVNVFIALFSRITQDFFGEVLSLFTLHLVNFFFTFFIVSLICGVIYRIFSLGKVDWGRALIGGSVAGLFFIIVNYLLGLYVQVAELNAFYGLAGSIVIMLLWIFYMINIFLFGAYVSKRKGQRGI